MCLLYTHTHIKASFLLRIFIKPDQKGGYFPLENSPLGERTATTGRQKDSYYIIKNILGNCLRRNLSKNSFDFEILISKIIFIEALAEPFFLQGAIQQIV